jgi:hypothetical protein
MKKISHLILMLLLLNIPVFALDVYDEVAFAFRSGDSRQLATFFGTNIDLSILNKEDMYSKAQAELILKDFFSKNPPKTFNILHKGSSPEGTQYAIGNLVCTNGKAFRISFYIKNSGGKNILQELRIEAE